MSSPIPLALATALPAGTQGIGGYWTRTNDPEIDSVGADRSPLADRRPPTADRRPPTAEKITAVGVTNAFAILRLLPVSGRPPFFGGTET